MKEPSLFQVKKRQVDLISKGTVEVTGFRNGEFFILPGSQQLYRRKTCDYPKTQIS